MATATAILNKKYHSKNGYQVGVLLINGRKQKFHKSGYLIEEKHWGGTHVKESHPDADIINSILEDDLTKAKRYFRDCRISDVPIDLELVFKEIKSHSWTDYLRHRAKQHEEAEQIEMKLKCDRFAKEFVRCFGRDIYFSELTQDNLRKYDAWLMKENPETSKKANSANTRKKKFEFLGKYFNNAIDDKKVIGENPFEKYSIKGTPVKKDKLTIDQIKAIEDLDLKPGILRLAKDLFLFSYYCKGLRFENCIAMPKGAIINGRLHYRINKGNKYLSTLIHPKLQTIIDNYIENETDTIFGRFNLSDIDTPLKKRKVIGSENAYINKALKDIAMMAGIKTKLSMHISRHSFAFHLKQVSDNIHVIKESLGHTKTSTTETYLQSLGDEFLDKEVAKVYER